MNRLITLLITVLGLGFTAFGGWAAFDPASFPAADFPPFNVHLIHDVAATFAAFGLGLLIAAGRPTWRTPVLTLAALWNGLHLISHIVDVDRAATERAGVSPIVELAVATAVLALLAWHCRMRGVHRA